MSIHDYNNLPDVVDPRTAFTQPNAKPKKKKNFLLDQISTVGGILGGIGGSLLSPIAGTAAGSGVGSALGQALENAITGDAIGNGVVKEGLVGGVLGVGPLKLGGKVLTKVAPRAGKSVEEAGANLLGSQANLTRAEARRAGVNPQDTFREINKRTGLTNMNKVADVSKNVTGENGVLSELTRNAIGNTKGVDIGDLRSFTDDLLVNKAPSVTGSVRKNVQDQIKNSVVKAYGGSKGSLSTLADPYEAFDVARTFESNASRLRTLPNPTSADRELATVYSSLAKEINSRLASAPGVADGVVQARQQAAESFRQLAASAPSRSERAAYEKLAQETEGLTDVASVRSAQAPFVQAGKIDKATAQAQAGAGAQLGGQMTGLGRFLQRPTNAVAIPLNAATPSVGGVLTKVGRNLQQPATAPSALGIAGRVGVGGVASGLAEQLSASDNLSADTPVMNEGAQLPMGTPPEATPQGTGQEARAAVQQILASGGSLEDATKYVSLLAALNEIDSPATPKLSATQVQQANNAQSGLSDLQTLSGMLQQDPRIAAKAAIPGGGLARRLTGTTDYDAAKQNIVDVISRLRSGAAITNDEARRYMSLLPGAADSAESAQAKIARLTQLLSGFASPQPGGSDLASALGTSM